MELRIRSELDPAGRRPPKGRSDRPQRILTTAGELFCREGVRAIGVDMVVQQFGASKTSLNRLFNSKDASITAFAG